jgi:hypothetical protein
VASAKAAGLTAQDMAEIIDYLAANPDAGDVIPGTGAVAN